MVTVSFDPVEYMVSEVMGSVMLRLIKTGAIDTPVTVTVSTMDGTASYNCSKCTVYTILFLVYTKKGTSIYVYTLRLVLIAGI